MNGYHGEIAHTLVLHICGFPTSAFSYILLLANLHKLVLIICLSWLLLHLFLIQYRPIGPARIQPDRLLILQPASGFTAGLVLVRVLGSGLSIKI